MKGPLRVRWNEGYDRIYSERRLPHAAGDTHNEAGVGAGGGCHASEVHDDVSALCGAHQEALPRAEVHESGRFHQARLVADDRPRDGSGGAVWQLQLQAQEAALAHVQQAQAIHVLGHGLEGLKHAVDHGLVAKELHGVHAAANSSGSSDSGGSVSV